MTTTLFDAETPTTALVEREATPDTPAGLIALAIQHGQPLEKLMDLQERWDRNRAAEAYAEAITNFQAKCPVIGKKKTAKIFSDKGSYEYTYAGFDDVMEQIKPLLNEFRLAIGFSEEHTENGLRTTCRIRHGIHVEDHTLTVPIPSSMKVNATQQYGAALTYARRYCLCAALNIVCDKEDNDAAKLCETIGQDDIAVLNDWLGNTDTKLDRFLKWAQVDSLSNFPASKMDEAIRFLKAKAGR